MKPFIWPLDTILTQSDFSERQVMIEANIKRLGLGPIQSKKYFESIAVLIQGMDERLLSRSVLEAEATLKRFHRKGF